MLQRAVKLHSGEEIIFDRAAGYFPTTAPFCRGGRLVVTNHRVLFVPHKIDKATGAADIAISKAQLTGVGSTPRPKSLFPRKWLRVDAHGKSWLFLFSAFRPALRSKAIEAIAGAFPSVSVSDGWGLVKERT